MALAVGSTNGKNPRGGVETNIFIVERHKAQAQRRGLRAAQRVRGEFERVKVEGVLSGDGHCGAHERVERVGCFDEQEADRC